jgi:hypothetical protein
MELLTDELRAELPPLYAQEGCDDPMVYIKFFTPDANWTWFVTEGELDEDGKEFLFFGYVNGLCLEAGYFSLDELQSIRGPLKLPIERDVQFSPALWSEVQQRERITS